MYCERRSVRRHLQLAYQCGMMKMKNARWARSRSRRYGPKIQTTLKVNGMMCGMCESHINDVVRKTAQVEKVTSSHTKGETVIVSAQPLDIEALKAAIADTGYTVTGAEEKPYEKKGFFSFLKH